MATPSRLFHAAGGEAPRADLRPGRRRGAELVAPAALALGAALLISAVAALHQDAETPQTTALRPAKTVAAAMTPATTSRDPFAVALEARYRRLAARAIGQARYAVADDFEERADTVRAQGAVPFLSYRDVVVASERARAEEWAALLGDLFALDLRRKEPAAAAAAQAAYDCIVRSGYADSSPELRESCIRDLRTALAAADIASLDTEIKDSPGIASPPEPPSSHETFVAGSAEPGLVGPAPVDPAPAAPASLAPATALPVSAAAAGPTAPGLSDRARRAVGFAAFPAVAAPTDLETASVGQSPGPAAMPPSAAAVVAAAAHHGLAEARIAAGPAPKPAPPPRRAAASRSAPVAVVLFDVNATSVRFNGKLDLTTAAKDAAELARAGRRVTLLLIGHADSVGHSETNRALSEARAHAAASIVIAQLDEELRPSDRPLVSVQTAFYGESRPAFRGGPDEGRNRRVEVFLSVDG